MTWWFGFCHLQLMKRSWKWCRKLVKTLRYEFYALLFFFFLIILCLCICLYMLQCHVLVMGQSRGLCSFPSCGPRDWTLAILMALQFSLLQYLKNVLFIIIIVCVGAHATSVYKEVRGQPLWSSSLLSLHGFWVSNLGCRQACGFEWQLDLLSHLASPFVSLSKVLFSQCYLVWGGGGGQKCCSAHVNVTRQPWEMVFSFHLHLFVGSRY